jgi:hypothetical protein
MAPCLRIIAANPAGVWFAVEPSLKQSVEATVAKTPMFTGRFRQALLQAVLLPLQPAASCATTAASSKHGVLTLELDPQATTASRHVCVLRTSVP